MQLFSRLSSLALVLLSSLVLLSCASPLAAPAARGVALPERGLVARTTAADTANILTGLKADIDVQLGLLDKCLDEKKDPTEVILAIEVLIKAAAEKIGKLKVDLSVLLSVQLTVIVKLVVGILISVATHCGKWVDKGLDLHISLDVFLALCAKLDVVLQLLLSKCSGLSVLLIGLIKVLINVSILVKVQFNLCIDILGL